MSIVFSALIFQEKASRIVLLDGFIDLIASAGIFLKEFFVFNFIDFSSSDSLGTNIERCNVTHRINWRQST